MNKLNHSLAAAALAALVTPLAHADTYPTSIVGQWALMGNQYAGTLNITAQAATGKCRAITGTVYGENIQGFYCPASGRFQFLRKLSNGATFQVWSGQLSDRAPVLRMGGTFSSVDGTVGGALGYYNFHAEK